MPDKDIVKKLHGKVFTRHIVRQILGHLSDEDLKQMYCVSPGWRTILDLELSNSLITKITKILWIETYRVESILCDLKWIADSELFL